MSNTRVDNVAWVARHRAQLAPYIAAGNVELVFRYVIANHPLHGMAVSPPPTIAEVVRPNGSSGEDGRPGGLPDAELAAFANAVTVACVDILPRVGKVVRGTNVTGLANVAYVALHATDPATRAAAVASLVFWRAEARGAAAPQTPAAPTFPALESKQRDAAPAPPAAAAERSRQEAPETPARSALGHPAPPAQTVGGAAAADDETVPTAEASGHPALQCVVC